MIAADGPGAGRVRGFLHNTHIFQVVKSAFGHYSARLRPARPEGNRWVHG